MPKFVSPGKLSSCIIYILLVIFAVGCSKNSNTAQNSKSVDLEIAMEEDILSEKIGSNVNVDEQNSFTPLMPQWRPEDRTYAPKYTIYYKTYYDDFVRSQFEISRI